MQELIYTAAIDGIEAKIIEVQSNIERNLPRCIIVGLPDTAVQEAKERVRSAIQNSEASYPKTQITVNLSPASLRKEGSNYDLPIAVSILLNSHVIDLPIHYRENSLFLGELTLDGRIKPVRGVLACILAARENNLKYIFLPKDNAEEAGVVEGMSILPLSHINDIIQHFRNEKDILPYQIVARESTEIKKENYNCFSQIVGQSEAKRALEIVAAGAHNILLNGSPGCGKTLLSRALPGILPNLSFEESLEVTKIHSIAGFHQAGKPLIEQRPFRSPHHTSSSTSLVGGGSIPKPGEITLAHRGVLFLDEFSEFPQKTLDMLRQPIEDKQVSIARAKTSYTFPADFILIAASNPCFCGYLFDKEKSCTCSPKQIQAYQKRISGPLLDRIDLNLEVNQVSSQDIQKALPSESSETIRKRVIQARKIQHERYQNSWKTNSLMHLDDIKKYCLLDTSSEQLIQHAIQKYKLSMRSYYRILKVARTIADLEEKENIQPEHIAEALRYRKK